MDNPLLELETYKINMEIPAPVTGMVRAIFVAPGERVPVGAVLALIGEKDEPLPEPASLPGQPLEGVQRRAERTKGEKPFSLATIGWLSISCALALLLVFQRLWPAENWSETLLADLLHVCMGVWLGMAIQKWRGQREKDG
jgi:pyruvate/2-oxoglutarate dehydrogenase complex dihydrolipoamide acyltransferase (E2) component